MTSEWLSDLFIEEAKKALEANSMPANIVLLETNGTAGQFAVSDGKGGIAWKTLVEAEAVMY